MCIRLIAGKCSVSQHLVHGGVADRCVTIDLVLTTSTVELADSKSLLPRVYGQCNTAVCDLQTRLSADDCQLSHDHITFADVEVRTATDVVDPDELAVRERRQGDLPQLLDDTNVVARRVVYILVIRNA